MTASLPDPDWRAYRTARASFATAALVALMVGCATPTPAPVEDRNARAAAPRPTVAAPAPAAPVVVAAPDPEPPRATTYTVKRGDTLYLIALDHGLDYRELAVWNNIANVDRIFAGQVLRLSPPGDSNATTAAGAGGVAATTTPLKTVPPVTAAISAPPGASSGATPAAPAGAPPGAGPTPAPAEGRAVVASGPPPSRHSDSYKTQPKAVKEPYSEHALREMQRAGGAVASAPAVPSSVAAAPALAPSLASAPGAPVVPPVAASGASAPPASPPEVRSAPLPDDDDDKLGWVWPSTGKIVTGFSDTANLKGIDIAGKAGQPVVASAAGKVVYAGSGLRGYGKLIIIKHNKAFLSAYAHNKEILVKEGQQVARGQKIAEMGNTDADQHKLHFEIRRLGKPMDPLKYLPPA